MAVEQAFPALPILSAMRIVISLMSESQLLGSMPPSVLREHRFVAHLLVVSEELMGLNERALPWPSSHVDGQAVSEPRSNFVLALDPVFSEKEVRSVSLVRLLGSQEAEGNLCSQLARLGWPFVVQAVVALEGPIRRLLLLPSSRNSYS